VVLDSAPLKGRWTLKTKQNPNPFDQDASWGFLKSKG